MYIYIDTYVCVFVWQDGRLAVCRCVCVCVSV